MLESIYYNPKDSQGYASVSALFGRPKENGANMDMKAVPVCLADQDGYTLHRQYRKSYKRNPIVVGGRDKQCHADLADLILFEA